jgi:hypothetical protein
MKYFCCWDRAETHRSSSLVIGSSPNVSTPSLVDSMTRKKIISDFLLKKASKFFKITITFVCLTS